MTIGLLKEPAFETRVSMNDDAVASLSKKGIQVLVEFGAGEKAFCSDNAYEKAGAKLVAREELLKSANLILAIHRLNDAEVVGLGGKILLGAYQPLFNTDAIKKWATTGLTVFSLDMLPRTTRAQAMDILSSQANIAGYKAVLTAANSYSRYFPMFMTAAGSIAPAKVLILGAGVAGLQAIATAKRLGAVVSAYDVRPASADEVKSMGAKFITLELEALEGAGGYAREMTEERAAKQRELLTPYIAEADVLITTAAVPGRTAPRLVTAQMAAQMKPGSVIVDLAAESGGNVEGSVAGEVITTAAGVTMWGGKDVPSQLPYHASMLFSRNVVNLLMLMSKSVDGKPTGELVPDFSDEIIDSAALTHAGAKREKSK